MRGRIFQSGMTNWIKLNQYIGIFMFLNDLYHWGNNDVQNKFACLLATLYVEKFWAAAFQHLDKITAIKRGWGLWDEPKHDLNDYEKIIREVIFEILSGAEISKEVFNRYVHGVAAEIEDNYSTITKLLPEKISQIPETILRHLPAVCKQAAAAITHELSMTTNELIIRSLKQGRCAQNIHMQLEALTEEEASQLIEALKSGNVPYGLKISYPNHSINEQHNVEIESLLNCNDLRHAALACTTLQQGKRDDDSICSTLPQEILNHIYSYAYPPSAEREKRKTFVTNVTIEPISSLFKPKIMIIEGSRNSQGTLLDFELIPDYRP